MTPSTLATDPHSDLATQPPDLAEAWILLVDDNLQNRELMQAYLESLPCRIMTARDGIEAVDIIDEGGEDCPDLVLLGVMMPGMSGFGGVRKMQASPGTGG